MDEAAADGSALKRGSIESRESWKAAWTTLAILSISFGSPLLIVVGMKPMQEALGTERSVLALAGALVWVGTGAGGVLMGWLADRIGVRATVAIAASMMAAGLALSSLGPIWTLYVGQGLMVGLLGNGGIYAPLLVYVSRWFDRRRGTAIALISSGQYIAGVVWPTLFERGIAELGWQPVMRTYAVVVLRTVIVGAAFQAVAIASFLLMQDEVGLFAIAAAFGFGFSGIIPAYSVAIRDLFSAAEASWRIPLVLFTAMSGMAFGSWVAGVLYDHFGYYAPAFGVGVVFNLANLLTVGFLVFRLTGPRRIALWPALAS